MATTTTDRMNGINEGVAIKAAAKVATTANITLSGLQTIDGYVTVEGDRVLVKDQTNTVENGMYSASTSAWQRTQDFDGSRDAISGTLFSVLLGTENAGSMWRLSTVGDIVIGTTALAIESFLPSSTTVITTPSSAFVNPMDFGAINDGSTHPLSDYYSTLAAAQADYPTADALTDERDSVAIEKALAYAVTNNISTIYFPSSETAGGYYRINKFIDIPYTLGGREGVVNLNGDISTADKKGYVTSFRRTVSAAGFRIIGTSFSVNPSNYLIKRVNINRLTFDGGWSTFSTSAAYPMIECDAAYELFWDDVVVTNCTGHGILLREVMDSRFNNVRITWCGQHSGYQKSLTMTSGSTTATMSDTTGLYEGQRIYGTGVQTIRVASITNSTTIVLSANANYSGTRTVGFEAKAAMHVCSNDTTNATSNNLVLAGFRIENGPGCGLRVQGSNIIDIFLENFKIEHNDYATDYLLDIDTCTEVTSRNSWLYASPRRLNYMSWSTTTAGKTLASLSSASIDSFSLNTYHTDTGTITNGSAALTGLTDTSTLTVGQRISGTGLADDGVANVCISSIDSGTQVTMTSTGTAAAAGTKAITFQYEYDSGNFNRRQFYTGLPIIAYDTDDVRNYYIGRVTNYTPTTGALSVHVLNVFGDTSKSITNWQIAVCHIGLAYYGQSAINCRGDFEGGYPGGTPLISYPYLHTFVHLDGIKGYEGNVRMNAGTVMLPKNSWQAQNSSSSVAIGTGAKTFTINTGLHATMFVAGAAVYVSQNSSGSESNWMKGTITSYTSGTGALVTNITETSGSGTIASWKVAFAPQPLHLQTGTNSDIVTIEKSPTYATPAPSYSPNLPIVSDVRAVGGAGRIKSVVSMLSTVYATITPDSSTVYIITDTGAVYIGSTTATASITNATMQASTSGTSRDFTSIPSSKRIVVSFSGVSTNGTSVPIIQLGTSSTPKTSGYICSTSGVANAAATATAAYTTGFGLVTAGAAAATIYGSVIFTLMDASTNLWAVTGSVARNDATVVYSLGGSVALSGTLDMVRITTVGGSDTFDAGNINIQYL